MKKPITTIIFDFGDVLVRDNINLFEERFGYAKLSKRQRNSHDLAVKRCELGKISRRELFALMGQTFLNGKGSKGIEQWLLKHSKPLPPLRLIPRLRKHGYRLLIISNNFRGWHELMEQAGNVTTKGIPFVNSAAAGKRKQDGALFRYAIRKYGINPETSLFIDDHTYNLAPAKKLKFRTILYRQDYPELLRQLKKQGVRI